MVRGGISSLCGSRLLCEWVSVDLPPYLVWRTRGTFEYTIRFFSNCLNASTDIAAGWAYMPSALAAGLVQTFVNSLSRTSCALSMLDFVDLTT